MKQDSYLKAVSEAADNLGQTLKGSAPPRLALILGSGLGEFAESLQESRAIPFSAIPHFPCSSVPGHSGNVVLGKVGGTPVVCLQGRVHSYEGHDLKTVTLPVRVLGMMGITRLIVTNAAGGINPRFSPGDLMMIRDHVSLFVPNPLAGPNEPKFGPRFPDMSEAYSAQLRKAAVRCAKRLGFRLKEGVYVCVTGPSYESPAEIQMLKRLGADAVGMSTVPEVLVARHMGIECLGISNITNLAAGISNSPLDHKEVLAAGDRVKSRFSSLLQALCAEVSRQNGARR